MRWLLALWAFPLTVFWGWYFLSLNDLNFGFLILSRQVHDFVFALYGHILGIDPASLPWMVAKACLFDTVLIAAIVCFRMRRQIAALARTLRQRYFGVAAQPSA